MKYLAILASFFLFLSQNVKSQTFTYDNRQLNEVYLFGLDKENSKYGNEENVKVIIEFSLGEKISIKALENQSLTLWNIDNIYSLDLTMFKDGDVDGESLSINIYMSKETEDEENPDFMISFNPSGFDFKFEPGEDGDLLSKCSNYILGLSNKDKNNLLNRNIKEYSKLIERLSNYNGNTKVSKINKR